MKRFLGLFLAAVFIFLSAPQSVFARQYALLEFNGFAKVTEIIDGDSLRVQFLSNGRTALVRLIGVDAGGHDNAIPYLSNTILGKTVALYFDDKIPKTTNNRWNNMYVYLGNNLVNRDLIYLGYAKANINQQDAALYELLTAGETSARTGEVGVWAVSYDIVVPSLHGVRGDYNINTASRAMLRELFNASLSNGWWVEGVWVDSESPLSDGYWLPGFWREGAAVFEHHELIEAIILCRTRNPFRTVTDLKFVRGMTKEIYDRIYTNINVSTNIITASPKELCTLWNISIYEVNRILRFRGDRFFSSKLDLLENDIIMGYLYSIVEPYIDIINVNKLNFSIPDLVLNVNSADAEELANVGLFPAEAERIENARLPGYTYKTLGEIGRLLGFSHETLNSYADNLVLSDSPNYYFVGININTATVPQLLSIGLSPAQADAVYLRRGRMITFFDIPEIAGLTGFDDLITLYTNINTASHIELESLSPELGAMVISELINYRAGQPFGSLEEVSWFFRSRGLSNLYSSFSDYIVVR